MPKHPALLAAAMLAAGAFGFLGTGNLHAAAPSGSAGGPASVGAAGATH